MYPPSTVKQAYYSLINSHKQYCMIPSYSCVGSSLIKTANVIQVSQNITIKIMTGIPQMTPIGLTPYW